MWQLWLQQPANMVLCTMLGLEPMEERSVHSSGSSSSIRREQAAAMPQASLMSWQNG
jgi:hypothetical protein